MASQLTAEIAAAAARLVVDEGMEYGPAKRRAARDLARRAVRAPELPSNEDVEDEVRQHIALFYADTQPAELAALRQIAMQWMERLQVFRPHVTGAVWRGTATRLSSIHLDLYCDDAKQAEIELLNQHIAYDVRSRPGPRGQDVDVLTLSTWSEALNEEVSLHLSILDLDDLRGALKPNARGQSLRGNLVALQALTDPS